MHTAEHILNQTMVRMYDCGRCFTAHLGRKKSKCDYHFDHALNNDEIAEIQYRVNSVIDSDLPIPESFFSKGKAEGLNSKEKLPDTAVGDLRLVNVGDYEVYQYW